MKDIIALLKQHREAAPDEPAAISAERKTRPRPVFNGHTKAPPRDGSPEACNHHARRRANVAAMMERSGHEKVTIRHEGFTLTVWNTRQTFDILIKNANRK